MAYNLKDENDVKEYLKNLHIEYQFGCYSEKNPNACHLLGEYTEQIKKDTKKALKLYKTNCDVRNHGRSCAKYGDFKVIGKECEQNELEGYQYLKKSCDLNDESGCVHGGIVSFAKSDKAADEKEKAECIESGLKMLKKACNEYKSEKGCFFLSGVYLKGVKGHLEKDFQKAFQCSLVSCEYGNPYACANIAQMYERGEGVKQNKIQAEQYKRIAKEIYEEIQKSKQLKFHEGIE